MHACSSGSSRRKQLGVNWRLLVTHIFVFKPCWATTLFWLPLKSVEQQLNNHSWVWGSDFVRSPSCVGFASVLYTDDIAGGQNEAFSQQKSECLKSGCLQHHDPCVPWLHSREATLISLLVFVPRASRPGPVLTCSLELTVNDSMLFGYRREFASCVYVCVRAGGWVGVFKFC